MKLYLIAPRSQGVTEYASLVAEDGLGVTRFASAAIATVAALAPSDFEIRLCDEENEAVDYETDADVVGLTVNVSQAQRALEIAARFRAAGKTVVMGGPHVSLAPELFAGHADALMVGELETAAERFFGDLRAGALKPRYDAERGDLALSPAPRWDLYRNDRAVSGVVQTSRGCPFECSFCDVIQYLGRVQRHKRPEQVIAEAQALYDFGYGFISLADDNFTVYRRRARELLTALAAWNGKDGRDYVTFATQMSIDVARDAELLDLCNDAGLLNAFIGIETSDPAALGESSKRQNMRVDLVDECRKIASAGLRIEAGLMVGFDSDDLGVFERQFEFAMSLPVPTFNVSVLVAPVATPLFERMRMEGRIVADGLLAQFPAGNLITNIEPAQMSRQDLAIGARWLINRLFDPEAFYARTEHMAGLMAAPPWVRHGGALRAVRRPAAVALFQKVVRESVRADRRIAELMRRMTRLMRCHPELREGLTDALSHYLMTRRGYQRAGIIVDGLDRTPAPDFDRRPAAKFKHVDAREAEPRDRAVA